MRGCSRPSPSNTVGVHPNNFQKYPPKELLVQAMRFGNRKVLQAAVETGAAGMGTTLTAALVLEDESKIYIGHVGDSRAYLISNGEIRQVTEDHSLAGELVRNGAITEEGKERPARNALTAALGTEVSVPAIYRKTFLPEML